MIFVGTLQEERRGYARLKVAEVWSGPDLADEVWVLSGQAQAPWPFYFLTVVGSSNDVSFVEDQPFVVGASNDFTTGECSVSWLDQAAERADARQPSDNGLTGADPPHPTWLGVIGLGALPAALIAGLLYRRQRRRPVDTTRSDS